jgi:AsmA family protein
MIRTQVWRRGLAWTVLALAAVSGLLLLFAAALDAGHFHGLIVRLIAQRLGRDIHVDGALRIHVLSLEPRVTAERVSIGNPPWTPPGLIAEIGKLSLVLALPGSGRPSRVQRLEVESTTLHLRRDSAGLANWQQIDPRHGTGHGLPLIRSLSMPGVHVVLDDELRHVTFDGTVSAQDDGQEPGHRLHIEGAGQLNGRTATIELNGDPLDSARLDQPYRFGFEERSGATHLSGSGVVLKPFDLTELDITFDATGPDLKDLYFLTGNKFIDTGHFEFSGKLARRGRHSEFSDLAVSSGASDLHGSASIESFGGRSTIDAKFNSQLLRAADLGLRAAGREPEPDSAQRLLLSVAEPDFEKWRRRQGHVDFRAQSVDVGPVPLHGLIADLVMDHGLVTVTSLTAEVLGGKLVAHLKLDARTDPPRAEFDLNVAGAELGLLPHKGAGPPSVEGPLQLHVDLTGRGKSVHQMAANADGTLTALLAHGTIRAALAELTGIDLRGLGLLLAKSRKEDEIRCGAAIFAARDGTLTAQNLVLDTVPVLISGHGVVNLGVESLDLKLQGHPKGLRLMRLRSPLLVSGTLAHPKIGVDTQGSSFVLVDPGRAKDIDCTTLGHP